MKIRLLDGLPFVDASVFYRGQALRLDHVLLDTGSAGSIFAADRLHEIGVSYLPDDEIYRIRGVGGAEFVWVYSKSVTKRRMDADQWLRGSFSPCTEQSASPEIRVHN